MQQIEIAVSRVGDPPVFADLADREYMTGELTRAAILQSGMKSGKASMMLYVETDAGLLVQVELSAGNFERLAAVARGACQSWGETILPVSETFDPAMVKCQRCEERDPAKLAALNIDMGGKEYCEFRCNQHMIDTNDPMEIVKLKRRARDYFDRQN